VMVQGGDMAPTDSVRQLYRYACEAYAKNVAVANKLADETLPSLNKLLEAERLAPLSLIQSSVPTMACQP